MIATTWGQEMIDPSVQDPGLISQLGPAGLLGSLFAVVVAAALGLRKYLSNESVTTAANSAQTELINMLRQQITIERDRADKAEATRDSAIAQISELKAKVEQLSREVQALRAGQNGPATP